MNKNTPIEAIVERIIEGHHGRFAVTRARGFMGSVTFSLENGVWQEEEDPESGIYVILSDIRKKHVRDLLNGGRIKRDFSDQKMRRKIL